MSLAVGQNAPAAPSHGLRVGGRVHCAGKSFWSGTHRTVAPAETLRAVTPSLPIAGVTRLANITGLDRVGIPVTVATRPDAATLSTSTGKGFTLDSALTSGAMEAIELFHAEDCDLPSERRAYDELAAHEPVVSRADLPLARNAPFSTRWPYWWTRSWDLMRQETVWLPLAAVHMGDRPTKTDDLSTFYCTSNGLASGNVLLEAIAHALYEVIERDALTCQKMRRATTGQSAPVVRHESVDHPAVRSLLDTLRVAHITTVLFDCTVDTGVPVYMAYLLDDEWSGLGVFKGAGAHLDPEIAMTRAITEAVQGRAVYIAGARDDLFRQKVVHLQSERNDRAVRSYVASLAARDDATMQDSAASETFHEDVARLLDRLTAVGIERALLVDLDRPDFPISVVKVVVPGMEGYGAPNYRPGVRARRFAACGSS